MSTESMASLVGKGFEKLKTLGRGVFEHTDEVDNVPSAAPSEPPAITEMRRQAAALKIKEERLSSREQALAQRLISFTQAFTQREARLRQFEATLLDRQTRLEEQELPFLMLLPKDNNRITPGLYVDPRVHSAFTPAIKVEVKSDHLVGREVSLIFRIIRKSDNRSFVLTADHKFTKGINTIFPDQFLKVGHRERDDYAVTVSLSSDFILNRFGFPLGQVQEAARFGLDAAVQDYTKIINTDGLTFQDALDSIRKAYE